MTNRNRSKSESVTQAEINSILWRACDTFRGAVDPSEYKNYILVMLFVKYISDVWQDHYDKLVEEFGNPKSKTAKERIERRLKRERFVLPSHCTFGSLYEQRNAANIGEIINTALDEVEDSNKEKLEGVFRNIDFNSEASLGQTKERNTRLKSLLEDFSDPKLDLRPSRVGNMDVIGNAYEYLIGRFAAGAGKKAGEFYTPPEVSQLIARLVDPQPGERICDPACGSGSLLIKCGQQVGSKDFSLYGQDNIGATWALAKMNMFLHAMDNARIEWGDTIRNPKLLSDDRLMKFEVVVANPPFSLDKWGQDEAKADHYNRFHRGVPPKSKGDYAFISHMIESITETSGRVGVVVPHGVLFRGSGEGKIRKHLIEENLLDAVVGLPANLFYGTGIPAAILVFRKQKSDRSVLFIDASREYDDVKTQNRLADEHIEKIVATYKARSDVDKYAYVADFEQIKENDFNLNIPRYVDTFEEEVEIDISSVQSDIDRIDSALGIVTEQLNGLLESCEFRTDEDKEDALPVGWKAVRLRDVTTSHAFGPRFSAELYSDDGSLGTIRTTDLDQDGNINYSTIPYAAIDPSTLSSHILNTGDLLITRSGTCGVPCIFEEQEKPVVAGAFLIRFQLSSEVNPYYLFSLLKTAPLQQQIQAMASGGVQKNLTGTNLLTLKFMLPPLPVQNRIVEVLTTADEQIALLRQKEERLCHKKVGMMQELLTGKLLVATETVQG